jgi:hypothetical protein
MVEHADGRLEILKFNANGKSLETDIVTSSLSDAKSESDQWVTA